MSAVYDNWERLVNAVLLREKLRQLSREDSISTISSSEFTWSFRESNSLNLGISFSYEQIAEATNRFSDKNLIKRGHSGDLFAGNFPKISTTHFVKGIFSPQASSTLAVKRIRFDQAWGYWENLSSEVTFFWRISNSHSRFVPLVGHCFEAEDQKFLIYKYLEKRDLANSLFKKARNRANDRLPSLDWIKRLKIARGVAEGLTYLHHECYLPLAHGDVQASSILVDHHFEVRLGSLNKISAQDKDSGDAKEACAYDVYCFGKVLLELVTGNLGISSSTDATLKESLETTIPYINIFNVERIVDPSLIIDEGLVEEVWAVAVIAKSCLNPHPRRRPLMQHILKALEDPLYAVRGDDDELLAGPSRRTTKDTDWNAHSSWLLELS